MLADVGGRLFVVHYDSQFFLLFLYKFKTIADILTNAVVEGN